MSEISQEPGPPVDVFSAAMRMASLDNSTARAVSSDGIEWQCTSWGSGRGRAGWEDTAVFSVVAHTLGLSTGRNIEGRDELVVMVPLSLYPKVMALAARLGADAPDMWPWMGDEEDWGDRLALAAKALDIEVDQLEADDELLELLGML